MLSSPSANHNGAGSKLGKASFLKKKKQKTFLTLPMQASPPQGPNQQKFLRRFFQKAATLTLTKHE
jgi:hypothetical protein